MLVWVYLWVVSTLLRCNGVLDFTLKWNMGWKKSSTPVHCAGNVVPLHRAEFSLEGCVHVTWKASVGILKCPHWQCEGRPHHFWQLVSGQATTSTILPKWGSVYTVWEDEWYLRLCASHYNKVMRLGNVLYQREIFYPYPLNGEYLFQEYQLPQSEKWAWNLSNTTNDRTDKPPSLNLSLPYPPPNHSQADPQ